MVVSYHVKQVNFYMYKISNYSKPNDVTQHFSIPHKLLINVNRNLKLIPFFFKLYILSN